MFLSRLKIFKRAWDKNQSLNGPWKLRGKQIYLMSLRYMRYLVGWNDGVKIMMLVSTLVPQYLGGSTIV